MPTALAGEKCPCPRPETFGELLREAILAKIASGTSKKLIAANAHPCQPEALHALDAFLAGRKTITLPVVERILDALRLSVVIRDCKGK